jgi:hypothetical protein
MIRNSPKMMAVVAYQPWPKGERRAYFERHSGARAKRVNPESRDYQDEIPGSRLRAPRNDMR